MFAHSRLVASRVYRAVLLLIAVGLLSSGVSRAQTLPPEGFQETLVYSGFTKPTLIRFAADGRVFVGEYGGKIWVYDDLSDTTRTLFADISENVFAGWDRGLLGMAIHPDFPATPYVYALYAYDAPPGEVAPYWNDVCPDPPGWTNDGCVVTGRLTRLEMDPGTGVMTGPEVVLIGSVGTAPNVTGSQWCQQYPSHSTGDLAFGADGMLYVSAGDGASFNFVDYGQGGGDPGSGTPANPCGDPPSGVGGAQSSPTAEGGALRSQDLLRSGDSVSYDGTILRVDPLTGLAAPGNPLIGGADSEDDRIVAFGLRNPFRITVQPGTNRVFAGDVGWGTWEEIDVIEDPSDAVVENFGWPCYEGGSGSQLSHSGYSGLDMCQELYSEGGSRAPGTAAPSLYAYHHSDKVVPGEVCGTGSSSIGGLAFNPGNDFPSLYDDALFFQDSTRRCIWAMLADPSGEPDPNNIVSFWANSALRPVDLTFGSDGNLYFADFNGGGIHRIEYFAANTPPIAVIDAQPSNGDAPLFVQFDASGSSDPDGDQISFEWDLDGDGNFDDSTAVSPTFTYLAGGTYTVQLRVRDDGSPAESSVAQTVITVDNSPPAAVILSPIPPPSFAVGELISFSGEVTDPEDGLLPPSQYTWTLNQLHCSHLDPQDCHTHALQTWNGVAGGSFNAPDHGYPSRLMLTLSGTDFGIGGQGALSDSVDLDILPATVSITINSNPSGLEVSLGEITETTPAALEVILNSQTTVATPSPQSLNGTQYWFDSWSDGGAQSHPINPQAPQTLVANFIAPECENGVLEGDEECDGSELGGASCADQGCSGGTPRCSPTCTVDYGSCTGCPVCDFDSVCDPGEDCDGCPSDCASSQGASCGDGICDAAAGEDCLSCAADCNGVQSGKRGNRFCCGAGGGVNPVQCTDARCDSNGWMCSTLPPPPTGACCGDGVCEGSEVSGGCEVDCGFCGDGTCSPDAMESVCSCAADCGAPPAAEQACNDGLDEDCDGLTDCADADCASDSGCSCEPRGASCVSDSQCCGGKCRGPSGSRVCK